MDERRAESLLSLGEEASPRLRGPDAKAALEHLEHEYSDLLAALQWFIDHEPSEAGNLSMVERQLRNLDTAEALARDTGHRGANR